MNKPPSLRHDSPSTTTSCLRHIYIYTYIPTKEALAGHRPGRCSAVGCLRKLASLQGVGGPTGAARSRRRGHGRAGKRSGPLWRGQISPASKQGAGGGCLSPRLPLRPVRQVRTRDDQKPARFLVAGTAKAAGRPPGREDRSPQGSRLAREARCAAREPGRCEAASRPNFSLGAPADAGQAHPPRQAA